MPYQIRALKIFGKQIEGLDSKAKHLIHEKIELVKQNPFRYKRIHSKNYSKVFRIRFSIDKKETRLIYAVIEPNIILVCLLDRKNDYKDLEKYLRKIKEELGI